MHPEDISARAHQIHSSAIVIDTHADTPQRFLFDRFDLGCWDAEGCVDIPRMRAGNVGAIFFAIWVPVEITGPPASKRALDLLQAVHEQVRAHPDDLTLAKTAGQILEARAQKKIAVLLGIEGGHAIDNDLGNLREFHARGARYMTLTHNAATDWADSSNQSPRHDGLTSFGKKVIREMNRLGMLIDVSHVSDKTFYDAMEISSAPLIASHSCCRAICAAPRNMTDEMIKAMAGRGGVIHITFHDAFLSQEHMNARRAYAAECIAREKQISDRFGDNEARKLIECQRLSDEFIAAGKFPQVHWEKIVEHIDHAACLAGADHVGLGSDFDGAFMPEGMEDATQLPRITESLLRRGYAESDIRKILGENTVRVMANAESAARECCGTGQRPEITA